MQSITSYIYEYEGDRRIRNAGFLKMQVQESVYILNLHVKSPLIHYKETWKLYAFHSDGVSCTLYPLLELPGEQHAINTHLSLRSDQFPEGVSIDTTEGFWIAGGGNRIFAVAWKPTYVNSRKFTIWETTPEAPKPVETTNEAETQQPAEPTTDETTDIDTEPVTETPQQIEQLNTEESTVSSDVTVPHEGLTAPANVSYDLQEEAEDSETQEDTSNISISEHTSGTVKNCEDVNISAKEIAASSTPVCESCSGNISCRKIQRQDMTELPRKEWFLANNNFLLHGYHNYRHLILVEENGILYLGVPGIYDVREARAAQMFGFPRFSSDYVDALDLDEEECNSDASFGYWMRKIRR